MADLTEAYAAAAAGDGGTIVVRGSAGTGKTWLVAAAAAEFEAAGALVLTGGCPPDPGLGYVPWLSAWRGVPGDPDGFAALLAELAGFGELPARTARDWLAARVLERLGRQRRPVVLVVEDAHRIDPDSAALLEAVRQGASAYPLLVVVTTEGADPAADVVLEPLPGAEVEALVCAHARAGTTDARVAAIVARAAGNPLLAIELARYPGSTLPDSLRTLYTRRIRTLGTAGPLVVTAVALAGRYATERLVGRACGGAAADMIGAALTDGLLERSATTGRLRPRNRTLAEAAEALLAPADLQCLHAAIAREATRADAGTRARHAERAGDPAAGRAWLVAGAAAAARSAHRAAAEAYERALSVPSSTVDRAEATIAAADALRRTGAADRAVALLRRELDVLPTVDRAGRRRLLDRLRENLAATGDRIGALAALRDARGLSTVDGSDPALAARLDTAEGARLLSLGRYAEAAEIAWRAAELADEADDIGVRIAALCTRGTSLARAGAEAAGVELLALARRLGVQSGNAAGGTRASLALARVLADGGRYAESVRACRDALGRLDALGLPAAYGDPLRSPLAAGLTALGRWAEAEEACTDGPPALLAYPAEIAALRGSDAAAIALLSQASGAGMTVAAAVADRSAGRHREAVDRCRRALGHRPRTPDDRIRLAALGLGALADLVATGRPALGDDVPALAEELTAAAGLARDARAGSPVVAAYAALANAEASRLTWPEVTMWAGVVERFDALRMPWQGAYARLRWAEAMHATRTAGPVAEALRDAERVAVTLGAVPLRRELERLARRTPPRLAVAA